MTFTYKVGTRQMNDERMAKAPSHCFGSFGDQL
jgi:hypothetical protein